MIHIICIYLRIKKILQGVNSNLIIQQIVPTSHSIQIISIIKKKLSSNKKGQERERDREREKERNGKRIVTIRREKFSYIIRNEIERIVSFRKFERYSSFGEIRYEHEDIGKLEGSSVRLEKEPARGKNTAFFSFLDGKMIRGDPIEIKFKKVYCNKPLSPRGNGLYDT